MNIITKTGKASFRLACLGTIMGLLTAVSVEAGTVFSFSGSDTGGTGSATMEVDIAGNTLTASLNNTSPTTLDAPLIGTNTPGIVGFGLNILDPAPTLLSWSLTAFLADGVTLVTIGGTAGSTGDWVLNTTIAGVTLDFLPTTDNGIAGALYNPLATSGFGALPNYFTEATLTLIFSDAPQLSTEQCFPQGTECATFVRFQNVGEGGEGSLRLPGTTGTPGSTGDPGVPEPNSLSLLGLGMIASVFALRRRNRYFKA